MAHQLRAQPPHASRVKSVETQQDMSALQDHGFARDCASHGFARGTRFMCVITQRPDDPRMGIAQFAEHRIHQRVPFGLASGCDRRRTITRTERGPIHIVKVGSVIPSTDEVLHLVETPRLRLGEAVRIDPRLGRGCGDGRQCARGNDQDERQRGARNRQSGTRRP